MPPERVEPQGGQTVEHLESSHAHPAQGMNARWEIGSVPSEQVRQEMTPHLSSPLPPRYEPSHLMEITETYNVTDSCLTGPLILLALDPGRVYRRFRLL